MGEDSGQASGEEGLSDEEIAKLQQREDELIQANLDAQANKAKNKGNGHGGSQGRKKGTTAWSSNHKDQSSNLVCPSNQKLSSAGPDKLVLLDDALSRNERSSSGPTRRNKYEHRNLPITMSVRGRICLINLGCADFRYTRFGAPLKRASTRVKVRRSNTNRTGDRSIVE
jgi:hypothetical protein